MGRMSTEEGVSSMLPLLLFLEVGASAVDDDERDGVVVVAGVDDDA